MWNKLWISTPIFAFHNLITHGGIAHTCLVLKDAVPKPNFE